jgi:cytidine deaminase
MPHDSQDEELVDRALAARHRAYAPYSGFLVGCAVLAEGTVYEGANVENASYGLASCAERNAVNIAAIAGARHIERVAVATSASPPAAPCGICLQAIREFVDDPRLVEVLLVNPRGERRRFTLHELFPHGFRGEQLAAATTDEA